MAFLEQFSNEEKDLLVSLPYRVGVWLSNVDDTGGAKADFEEISELENIIERKSKGMFESAFVHEIMVETNGRQAEWRQWNKDLDNVLEQCGQAVAVISSKLEEKDLDAYRANIMAIALDVAKAFREFDDGASIFSKIFLQIRLFFEGVLKIVSRGKGRGADYDMQTLYNISYEEDIALTKLSEALHPGLDGSAEDAHITQS